MKRIISIPKIALLSLTCSFTAASLSGQIFSEDFQTGYSVGDLMNQQDWTAGVGTNKSPTPHVALDNGNYFIQAQPGDDTRALLQAGNFGLSNSDTITLTFDLRVSASDSNAGFGVGIFNPDVGSIGTTPHIGVQAGNWIVRGWSFGDSSPARDSSGSAIGPTEGDWYRVQSEWTLSGAGTATLWVKNLTEGETAFTQLFFNAAQDQTTATLNLDDPNNTGAQNWDGVFTRNRDSSIDNLTVVPEPATYALLLGLTGLALVTLRRYRRR